jgi:pimeloyl-ACP methyl ester carboxylesterase
MPQLRPAIIIPGIQGSMLQNFYPLEPATTWSTLTIAESKVAALDFNLLALANDGLADRNPRVLSRPAQLLDIAYAKLASGLQGRSDVPAYLFAYDWRYSIVNSAAELVRFVERLLLKPSAREWGGRFDFVCHSMGGLVFRQFLKAWGEAQDQAPLPVGRVAFIATPHKGSLDAVETLISGESPLLGGQKEMRKLARTFPAVYELLPLFRNGVMSIEKNGIELDPFDEKSWQDNTRSDFRDCDPHGFSVEKLHLDSAKAVLSNLPKVDDPKFGLNSEDFMVVYGVKQNSTKVSIKVADDAQQWYDFDGAEKGAGDSIVPVGSAVLPGVTAVKILDTDLSYFLHPIQRAMIENDLHAFLPALDEVQTIVASFFEGLEGKDLLPLNLQREVPSRVSIGLPEN